MQKDVGPDGVIAAVGAGLAVTTIGALVALQPELLLVTVTVYDPLWAALIDQVVSPLDHRYVYESPQSGRGPSRRTVPGVQNVVGPSAVIVAGGSALIRKLTGCDVALQPFASVTVTVTLYKPA